MKLSGILLVILSIVLATVNYISLLQNIAVKHGEIIMITIAAYTFYKITMAIVKTQKSLSVIKDNPKYRLCGSICFHINFTAVYACFLWFNG